MLRSSWRFLTALLVGLFLASAAPQAGAFPVRTVRTTHRDVIVRRGGRRYLVQYWRRVVRMNGYVLSIRRWTTRRPI